MDMRLGRTYQNNSHYYEGEEGLDRQKSLKAKIVA